MPLYSRDRVGASQADIDAAVAAEAQRRADALAAEAAARDAAVAAEAQRRADALASEAAARDTALSGHDSRLDTLEAAPPGTSTEWLPEFLVDGLLIVQDNIIPPGLRVPKATSLRQVHAAINVASAGAPVTAAVVRGTTVLATVTLAAGATAASVTLTTPVALAAGERLRLNLTSVGTTEPGQDLAVALVCS